MKLTIRVDVEVQGGDEMDIVESIRAELDGSSYDDDTVSWVLGVDSIEHP